MIIGIVGLGLIGGSIAKSIKSYTDYKVFGMNRNHAVIQKALKIGAIDEELSEKNMGELDILYLCMYPDQNIQFVKDYFNKISPKTVVTDVTGTKVYICNELEKLTKGTHIKFIGSHPMAGKEVNGFDNADEKLFKGASYIITPLDDTMKAEEKLLTDTAKKMGFGHIERTDPQTHDRMIAYTSQIPHVLACAYVMCSECEKHDGFSAGSYRDVSRVARINENLWADLFLENREILTKQIDNLIYNIVNLKRLVDKEDREGLREALKQSRIIKELVDGNEEDNS